MSKWKECKLGELIELVTKGTTPTTLGGKFTNKGINFIKSESVGYNGRIDKSKFVFIDEETHQKLRRSQLKKDDILFSMAGVFLGKNAIVTEDILPANTNQALAIIRLNQDKAFPKFVSYYLRQESVIEFINNMSGQSAQPNINFEEIKSIEIPCPPLSEQKAIAAVLGSLDNKVDLLHRQNTTLEALAETLFRQWFIVDAKAEWEQRPLSLIANFLNGLACQKYPPENEIDKLPVLKIKELSSGISESSDWATKNVKPEYIVQNGDVIFAWSASLMVKMWNGEDCVLNQHLFKVTSGEFPKWYYYMWSKHHLDEFIAIAASHATTMGHIKRKDLDEAMVLVPSDKELEEMTAIIEPLINKFISNNKQINSIIKLRDTTLPKLMSGQATVTI
ncbi:restriction endonuclease subunit S [Rufibacter sp. XAAS-G3-1]|uniref:restriction endonuclease subunit S n=1 Tax=Rufibacter sp. XAAS-G3-1 TaxID=2729134 RepID=UPI0015E7652B|nr:restriction endonuclease subunit S [Rufibacter sp. XAAS-G3-1]